MNFQRTGGHPESSLFPLLVCSFPKEPVELSDSDFLYLENYFKFKTCEKCQVDKINIY